MSLIGCILLLACRGGEPTALENRISSVDVTPSGVELVVGGTDSLTVDGMTDDGQPLDRDGEWTVRKSSVVSVEGNGQQRQVIGREPGITWVVVTVGGVADSAKLSVVNAEPVFSDGFESGDLSHSESNFFWELAWVNGGTAEVNTNNPRNGSYSLMMQFNGMADGDDAHSGANIDHPGFGEFWMEYYIWIPSNYHHRDQSGATNNKWWQVYDDRDSPGLAVISEIRRNAQGESDTHRYISFDGTGDGPNDPWVNQIDAPIIVEEDYGSWVQYRYHVKPSTRDTDSNHNGVYEIWKNGRLLHSRSDRPIWNSDPGVQFKGIRIFGWSNSGYDEKTTFYIDDVSIYTSDPGW